MRPLLRQPEPLSIFRARGRWDATCQAVGSGACCGGLTRRWLLPPVMALALLLPARPVLADASLAQCLRWQRSSGLERIQLGNAIGAAFYLTKVQRFAESDPAHPQLLYAPADLQRACDGWR